MEIAQKKYQSIKKNVEKQIYEIENAEEYNKILRTRIKRIGKKK